MERQEPLMDLLAFPENILACILESLPTEQLLNMSRVTFTPTQALQRKPKLSSVVLQSYDTWCTCPVMRLCKHKDLLKVCCQGAS